MNIIREYEEQLFVNSLLQYSQVEKGFHFLQLLPLEFEKCLVIFSPGMYGNHFFLLRSFIHNLHLFFRDRIRLLFVTDATDKMYCRSEFLPLDICTTILSLCGESRIITLGTSTGGTAAIKLAQIINRPFAVVNPIIDFHAARGNLSKDYDRRCPLKNHTPILDVPLTGIAEFSKHKVDLSSFHLLTKYNIKNCIISVIFTEHKHRFFWGTDTKYIINKLNTIWDLQFIRN